MSAIGEFRAIPKPQIHCFREWCCFILIDHEASAAVGLQIEDDLVKAFEPPAMTRIFPEIVSLVLAGPGDLLRSDSAV